MVWQASPRSDGSPTPGMREGPRLRHAASGSPERGHGLTPGSHALGLGEEPQINVALSRARDRRIENRHKSLHEPNADLAAGRSHI